MDVNDRFLPWNSRHSMMYRLLLLQQRAIHRKKINPLSIIIGTANFQEIAVLFDEVEDNWQWHN
jgi:hypothetical protein